VIAIRFPNATEPRLRRRRDRFRPLRSRGRFFSARRKRAISPAKTGGRLFFTGAVFS
jgi:hypothetical protein